MPALVRSEWSQEIYDDVFPFGVGITGWAVEHREPVLSNQAHLDPRVEFVPGTPLEPEALIVVPLIARGALKGTLNVYRIGEDAFFTEEEFELAKRLGDAAALALDNAHIRARLEREAQTDSLTGLYNHRYFHERLRRELTRAASEHENVALVMLDIDDFKKVNDVFGHAVGDDVLAELADHLRATVQDQRCRLPDRRRGVRRDPPRQPRGAGSRARDPARDAAGCGRSRPRRQDLRLDRDRPGTTARGEPARARRLRRGRDDDREGARQEPGRLLRRLGDRATAKPDDSREDVRSIAHLKMLQTLAGKLNRSTDVREIGMAIANELRQLIDYHNCRIFVRDGDELQPIAFQGELTAPERPVADVFRTRVGEGFTGRVVETGESLLLDDASTCEFAIKIEGTAQIEESIIAVPMHYGARVIGVIVVSKLGLNQFDADDLRLLEVLAGHTAAAVENARLYEVQRREAESAKALLEFGRDLAAAEGLEQVLERIVEGAQQLMGAPHASLWLQESIGGDVVGQAAHGYELGAPVVGLRFAAEVMKPYLARTGPYVISPEEYAALSDPPAESTGSYVVAPFTLEGRWGAIAVAFGPEAEYGDRELELLGGLAHQAKLAIANASSFAGLERTFLSTVEALANALEARDEYTSSHARWITDMAIRVGSELGLDGDTLKRLELGALFHDIGKIGIPNSVLLKPGPLSEEERLLIETHPELGEKIIAPIDQLQDVCGIVRACHERWDGQGYPDQKAGEEIPLEARIIFACDAFHAMTTDRPYRRALPSDEALRRLTENAGSQFDPQVVDVCLRVLDAPPN